MGLFLKTLRRGVIFFILAGIFVSIPNLPPDSIYEAYSLPTAAPYEGLLAVNEALNKGERLFENEIPAPEALAVYKNILYTGLADGRIVALKNNKLVTVSNLAKPCSDKWNATECGHILGIEFDKAGNLFAVDCYFGIYKINITTGASSLIIPSNKPVAGKLPALPDDIAIATDGSIYWSDASAKFPLHEILFSAFGDPSGRLIKTNPKTGKSEVLMDNLHFANGVFLPDDESYVAVAETFNARVHRYWLKGSKKGTHEVFLDNLPGFPDNLSPYKNGGFVVNLLCSREAPDVIGSIAPFPNVRKFIARSIALVHLAVQKAHSVYPSDMLKKASHLLTHLEVSSFFLTNQHSVAVIYDKNGKLVKSLHSTDGILPWNSDFVELGGYYYLGSPYNPFLGRVKVSK